jgi:hypothetical protein
MFIFFCQCGQALQGRDEDAGRSYQCPRCHQAVEVPGSSPPPSPKQPHRTWLIAAVVALIVVAGLGALMVRLLPPRDRGPGKDTVARGPVEPMHDGGKTESTPPQRTVERPLVINPTPAPDRPSPPMNESSKFPDVPTTASPMKEAKSDPFYQVVDVSRVSSYQAEGIDFKQGARYILVSSFQVKKKTADGGLIVRQKVESVQLTSADAALQYQLKTLLQQMRGTTFTLTLDAHHKVTKFEGEVDALKVLGGKNLLGGDTLLLWSFLDQDGWKELAEITFFQPGRHRDKGEKWSQPLSHNWGPLGSWSGKVNYAVTGKDGDVARIDYLFDLAYKPPSKKSTGLPIEIGKAAFQLQNSGGAILFDTGKGRVSAAEERFQVRGRVPVAALGVTTLIDMEEVQLFQVRIVDQNPLKEADRK